MNKSRIKKHVSLWIIMVSLVLAPVAGALAGILGTGADASILVPYVTKQIAILKKALQTANKTYGAINALKRGFHRIRNYNLQKFQEEAFWSVRELRELRREWKILHQGGYYYSDHPERLPEILDEIYRIPGSLEDPAPARTLYADGLAKSGFIHAAHQRERSVQRTRKQADEVFRFSEKAESLADATKLIAEGTAFGLQAKADELELQTQEVELNAAQLEIATREEFLKDQGVKRDTDAIYKALSSMKAMR